MAEAKDIEDYDPPEDLAWRETAIWLTGPADEQILAEVGPQAKYHATVISCVQGESEAFEGETVRDVLDQIADFLNDDT